MQSLLWICNRTQLKIDRFVCICHSAWARASIRCRWTFFFLKSSCQFRYETTFSQFTSVQFTNSCVYVHLSSRSFHRRIYFKSAKTTTQSWMSQCHTFCDCLPDIISKIKRSWSRLSGSLNYIILFPLTWCGAAVATVSLDCVCWHLSLRKNQKKKKKNRHPFTEIGAIKLIMVSWIEEQTN